MKVHINMVLLISTFCVCLFFVFFAFSFFDYGSPQTLPCFRGGDDTKDVCVCLCVCVYVSVCVCGGGEEVAEGGGGGGTLGWQADRHTESERENGWARTHARTHAKKLIIRK